MKPSKPASKHKVKKWFSFSSKWDQNRKQRIPNIFNVSRRYIGWQKSRYQEDGFDLDLTYITPNCIAMSLPALGAEAVYRNPMKEVRRFFTSKHENHYMIFNLCEERSYDPQNFDGRVRRIPVQDHNPPLVSQIIDFLECAESFMKESPHNVLAVHCKGGKGRTGIMICSWLMYSTLCSNATDALDHFARIRTSSNATAVQGVSQPSQIRYVRYVEMAIRTGGYSSPEITLNSIHIQSCPRDSSLWFTIEECGNIVYDHRISCGAADNTAGHDVTFELPRLKLRGDVRIKFYGASRAHFMDEPERFFLWFHTGFLSSPTLSLSKHEIDIACHDSKCLTFPASFRVHVAFDAVGPSAAAPAPFRTVAMLRPPSDAALPQQAAVRRSRVPAGDRAADRPTRRSVARSRRSSVRGIGNDRELRRTEDRPPRSQSRTAPSRSRGARRRSAQPAGLGRAPPLSPPPAPLSPAAGVAPAEWWGAGPIAGPALAAAALPAAAGLLSPPPPPPPSLLLHDRSWEEARADDAGPDGWDPLASAALGPAGTPRAPLRTALPRDLFPPPAPAGSAGPAEDGWDPLASAALGPAATPRAAPLAEDALRPRGLFPPLPAAARSAAAAAGGGPAWDPLGSAALAVRGVAGGGFLSPLAPPTPLALPESRAGPGADEEAGLWGWEGWEEGGAEEDVVWPEEGGADRLDWARGWAGAGDWPDMGGGGGGGGRARVPIESAALRGPSRAAPRGAPPRDPFPPPPLPGDAADGRADADSDPLAGAALAPSRAGAAAGGTLSPPAGGYLPSPSLSAEPEEGGGELGGRGEWADGAAAGAWDPLACAALAGAPRAGPSPLSPPPLAPSISLVPTAARGGSWGGDGGTGDPLGAMALAVNSAGRALPVPRASRRREVVFQLPAWRLRTPTTPSPAAPSTPDPSPAARAPSAAGACGSPAAGRAAAAVRAASGAGQSPLRWGSPASSPAAAAGRAWASPRGAARERGAGRRSAFRASAPGLRVCGPRRRGAAAAWKRWSVGGAIGMGPAPLDTPE